jgi:hypothetical protein
LPTVALAEITATPTNEKRPDDGDLCLVEVKKWS